MGIQLTRNLFLMVCSSRDNPYLCTNVVGDHGLDYALAIIISDISLDFNEIILSHSGLHYKTIPIMVLVMSYFAYCQPSSFKLKWNIPYLAPTIGDLHLCSSETVVNF